MYNTGGNWTLLPKRDSLNVNEHVNIYAKVRDSISLAS